jgi:16S rRNA (cytidine1402-2'-O)-methyltransferase
MLHALLDHLQPGTRLSVSCALTAPGAFTRSDSVARWRAQPGALPADRPVVFALLAE